MPALLAAIAAFFASLSGIIIGLGIALAFVVAAIADPSGWLNQSICFVIGMIVSVFPSSPPSFRLENIVVSLSSFLPSFAIFAVREAFHAFRDVFSFLIIFKIYKMIPFKST